MLLVSPLGLLPPILFASILVQSEGGQRRTAHGPPTILTEYRKVLPKRVFERFSAIYLDKSLRTIEKMKLLDELFVALPESLLRLMPVPSAFRKLPLEQQHRIHRVYYAKKVAFREKMRRLDQILRELPGKERELIPIRPMEERGESAPATAALPALIEFEVPVLLQFNGHMETHLLAEYLQKEEFELLKWIVGRKNMDELSRSRLVGVLLKQSYHRSPNHFPLPLNGDSREIGEGIRHLGVRLMFGQNPFDRIDPFAQKLQVLRRIQASEKARRTKEEGGCSGDEVGEPAMDCAPKQEDGAVQLERVDLFPESEVLDEWMRHRDATAEQWIGVDLLDKFLLLFNGTVRWNNSV